MTCSEHPSIRKPQSIARLSRTFSRSLSAVDIAEPLASLDEHQPVALGAFATADQVFIEWSAEVAGGIARRGLQKPPLRMWLFGAITVLDMNLTRAIEELYPGDSWRSRISTGRFDKAAALRAERQRCGSDCRLVDCLEIKDKTDILVSDGAHREVPGLHSRREANRLARGIEMLRNQLAHAQELENEHLAAAMRLASAIDSILRAEGVRRMVGTRAQPSSSRATGISEHQQTPEST